MKMGAEIHSASTVESPWVVALRELYDRLDTPYLGFIPDFGASTLGISPSVYETYRAKGVPEELLDAIAERWDELHTRDFEAGEEIGKLIGLAHQYGAGDQARVHRRERRRYGQQQDGRHGQDGEPGQATDQDRAPARGREG